MTFRLTTRGWVALVLLVAVLIICVSPLSDVPETALRANGMALRLSLLLIAFGMLLAGILSVRMVVFGYMQRDDHARASIPLVPASLPLLC